MQGVTIDDHVADATEGQGSARLPVRRELAPPLRARFVPDTAEVCVAIAGATRVSFHGRLCIALNRVDIHDFAPPVLRRLKPWRSSASEPVLSTPQHCAWDGGPGVHLDVTQGPEGQSAHGKWHVAGAARPCTAELVPYMLTTLGLSEADSGLTTGSRSWFPVRPARRHLAAVPGVLLVFGLMITVASGARPRPLPCPRWYRPPTNFWSPRLRS